MSAGRCEEASEEGTGGIFGIQIFELEEQRAYLSKFFKSTIWSLQGLFLCFAVCFMVANFMLFYLPCSLIIDDL
jgi:hypothetical protein